jgi:hypothetical protein
MVSHSGFQETAKSQDLGARVMKYVIAVVLLIIMITAVSCTKRDSSSKTAEPLDKEEIITAAGDYFQTLSLGSDPNMFYDEGNAIWKAHGAAFIDTYPGEAHKLELLEGHNYQLVRFTQQGDVVWLDLSSVLVFVDRNSGDVITTLWGKYTSRKPDTSE